MVEIYINESKAIFEIKGWHKIWTLKNRIEIPLENIKSIVKDSTRKKGLWKGWRLPGTQIPGIIIAGSFYLNGKWNFWDVTQKDKTVVVALKNERYHELVIDVANPVQTINLIEDKIKKSN